MLYPKMNAFRDVYSLNGVWNFKTVDEKYLPKVKAIETALMPVPASFNDIVTDRKTRDHVGKVLYETEFSLPIRKEQIYRLRIGSTSHKCEVYLNGEKIGEGINGHYPIDLELNNLQENNRLSVVIDNRLDFQCFPTAQYENGRQVINHDFYNYTGIHRDGLVYSLPKNYIEDIAIKTVVDIDYKKISVAVTTTCKSVRYTVLNRENEVVTTSKEKDIIIENPVKLESLVEDVEISRGFSPFYPLKAKLLWRIPISSAYNGLNFLYKIRSLFQRAGGEITDGTFR